MQSVLHVLHEAYVCVCNAGGAGPVGEKPAGRAEQPAWATTTAAAQRCHSYRTDVPGESGEEHKSGHVKFTQHCTTHLWHNVPKMATKAV